MERDLGGNLEERRLANEWSRAPRLVPSCRRSARFIRSVSQNINMVQAKDVVQHVDYEGEHITFRSIWHAALIVRECGEVDGRNGFWSLMAAMVLAYTAYEGFTNDLIERLYPDIWKSERKHFGCGRYRGTIGKTQFLADRLHVRLKRDGRPYNTVAELHNWRNDLVHPQTVRLKGRMRADAYSKKPRRGAPIAFAKLQRPLFVPRCFVDVAALGDILLEAAARENWERVRDLGESAFSGVLGSSGASLSQ